MKKKSPIWNVKHFFLVNFKWVNLRGSWIPLECCEYRLIYFLIRKPIEKMPKEKHQNVKIEQSTRVRSSDNIFHLWSMKWGQNSISSFDEFWSFAIQRNTNCEGKTSSFVSIERLNAIASAVEMYLHLNDLLKLLMAFLKSQYICIESIFFCCREGGALEHLHTFSFL